MSDHSIANLADGVLDLAQLSLIFGRTNRAPFHEDGLTPESDTDHTVMLSLTACALAHKYFPHLDIGLVAQFALVHDLVEAYAGDTPTLGISPEGRQSKELREQHALEQIHRKFDHSFSIIPELIERYETRQDAEARFVKAVDNVLPKAVWLLGKSGAVTAKSLGLSRAKVVELHQQELRNLDDPINEFPLIAQLRAELASRPLDIED